MDACRTAQVRISPKRFLIVALACTYARCSLVRQVLERYGGDDETRTRDLCRDRALKARNRLKFGGTDSHFRALNNASELLLDPDRTQILAVEFYTDKPRELS